MIVRHVASLSAFFFYIMLLSAQAAISSHFSGLVRGL